MEAHPTKESETTRSGLPTKGKIEFLPLRGCRYFPKGISDRRKRLDPTTPKDTGTTWPTSNDPIEYHVNRTS